ncbi:hypothetical protein DICPUDRAFT_43431 [Dictyostelium purpureum]|uniref:Anaphase-promoting complex subunit 13 n=1 Tax=Dictyostelium purpureum TaxID=5786 RepID=F1A442_DICPU|nr:uncharacterized protein DICPUDRAFT_43431 [Dictyostelium purpureum]EGC29037.1 hypothetical protein DICPUDRAFT_43431 [Dictyostelium purpureum]|eukprot:XP_003294435.1 hypothetical protein DICPUDRAFT_43431 [Dictyostelium purpureum]
MSDSSYSLYIHSDRKLIDIVDESWEKETLPQETIKHPIIVENINLNDEFDELLKQTKQEKPWNELALGSFN